MSKLLENIAVIGFLLLVCSQKIRSQIKTTSEDKVVTLNSRKSASLQQNTLSHVENYTNEVSYTSQQPTSTSNNVSGSNTGENKEPISTTNPSSTDTNNTETESTLNISLSTDISFSEDDDYGTVIESDVDTNTSTTYEEVLTTEAENVTNINSTKRITTKEPFKQPFSMEGALRDIAYYLRAYKFNEYDRRYETNNETAPRRFFMEFPRPPLRSLHWEVRKFCEPSFSGCVDYLRKRLRYVSLKRADDTVVVMQDQNWTFVNHSDQIKQIDAECKKLRRLGNIIAEPFEGPLERFQWRVTASYYMCWYTMQQVPELKHLSEHCDNFADCLNESIGPNNKDVRANDSDPYACARYSFCPNPCCPMKHLNQSESCWDSPENPCFRENVAGQRECAVNGSSNIEFRDIVLNRWNVTCRCPSGYEWNSRFGMCIDVNECDRGAHNCDRKLQQGCVNLAGSFRCACTWGHVRKPTEKQCIPSKALHLIKLSHKKDSESSDEKSGSLIRKLTKFFRKSAANTLPFDKIALLPNLLCVLLCLF